MKSISCIFRIVLLVGIYLACCGQAKDLPLDAIKALDIRVDVAFASSSFESSRPNLKEIIDRLSKDEIEKPEHGVSDAGFVLFKSEFRMFYIESKFGDRNIAHSHFLRAVNLGDDIGLLQIPQLSPNHRVLVAINTWIDWEKKSKSEMDYDFVSSYVRKVVPAYE